MSRTEKLFAAALIVLGAITSAVAHPGHEHPPASSQHDLGPPSWERAWTAATGAPRALLAQLAPRGAATNAAADPGPDVASAFDPFVKLKSIQTRRDDRYLYVESNGFPDHPMMAGITAWQQQVPIRQKYTGDNAWRLPLRPVPATNPTSTNGNFLRGAIALAVNGVPIFNPLNNRGDDALLAGELDEFGGHCGRADDYHYHVAPVHLQKAVGPGRPIAYALDGYPIYGHDEPDGSPAKPLDELNGHADAGGNYHYHATKKYPYVNGGFHGEVNERDGQVDPQPRAEPIRPALPPLRGAKVTGFTEAGPGSYRLTYDVNGKAGSVGYTLAEDGSAKFEFAAPDGRRSTATYAPKRVGLGGNDRSPPSRPGEKSPPRGRATAGRRPSSRATRRGRT